MTDEEGRYVIRGLPPGQYTIWAGKKGLPFYERTGLAVRGAPEQRLDIWLERTRPRATCGWSCAALNQEAAAISETIQVSDLKACL